jgi:hypothetical protein
MFGLHATVATAARAHRWLVTAPVPSTYVAAAKAKSNGIRHRPPGDPI